MRKERILVLALAQFFVALSTGFIGPVYAIYFEKIVGDTSLVAFIIGIYWIIVGILEIFSGYLVDKIGKGKVFLIGGVLSSIAMVMYSFVESFFTLLFVEVLNAIGYSLQIPSFFSILAEVTSEKNRGKEIGLVDSFWSIAYGFSAVVSGILIGFFGFSTIFIIAGMFNTLSSVLVGSKFKF
ncbi:MAG: MFS transporter [Candidatus Aenigmatarchaeota archaeon]